MDVGVDEARDEQPAVQAGDRLAGMRVAQRGERAPAADDAVADQQRAVLGQRASSASASPGSPANGSPGVSTTVAA